MSPSGLLEVLDRFFLDLIGTIIPGAALLYGLWVISDVSSTSNFLLQLPPTDLFDWVLLIVAGYALGYAIGSVGENVILRILEWWPFKWLIETLFPRVTVSD